MYGQYQTNVTPAVDGNSAQVRIDEQRRLIVTGDGGAVPIEPSATAQGIPVAASATNYALQFGGVGALGDYLAVLMIIPSTTSPGAVTFKDGTGGASITAFPGGANSVNTLHPFPFVVNGRAATGPWYVTTGAGVTVVASGEPA